MYGPAVANMASLLKSFPHDVGWPACPEIDRRGFRRAHAWNTMCRGRFSIREVV